MSLRDPMGLDVTMTCRPLSGIIAVTGGRHCAVVVWHWDNSCGSWVRVIDAQYSLPFGGTSPTGDPTNRTFRDDRAAFNNLSPYGPQQNYTIPAPAGMSQSAFDRAVMTSGNSYSQGAYSAPGFGPNSNTTANNIISNAGGTPPNVSGAYGQGYSVPSWGSGVFGGAP